MILGDSLIPETVLTVLALPTGDNSSSTDGTAPSDDGTLQEILRGLYS